MNQRLAQRERIAIYLDSLSMQCILLRGAKQLLTLRGTPAARRGADFGKLEIIEDGAVLIENGRISSVGPTRRLDNLAQARRALQVPAHEAIVMPGFVDPSMAVSLRRRDGPGRRKLADLYSETLTLIRLCLQHGTLNVGVRTSLGSHSVSSELSVLRQLARIGNNPVGVTRIWRPEAEADYKALMATILSIRKQRLASHVELKTTVNGYASLSAAANLAGMPVSLVWPDGQSGNLRQVLEQSGASTLFCRGKLSSEECELVADTGTVAVFNTSDSLDQQPDRSLQELVAAGGAVALGTGYDAPTESNFNMQLVLALAVRSLHLTIEQAIVAATINAAYALNCGDQVGSLEPGKRADLLVLKVGDYRELSSRPGVNHVALVIREGNLVLNRTAWKIGAV